MIPTLMPKGALQKKEGRKPHRRKLTAIAYKKVYDFDIVFICTQPLYNRVRYSTVLDITQTIIGPQMVILDLFY